MCGQLLRDWFQTSLIISLALSLIVGEKTCVVYHAGASRLGTLKYNSFRWRSIRMFNRLANAIRILVLLWDHCMSFIGAGDHNTYFNRINAQTTCLTDFIRRNN